MKKIALLFAILNISTVVFSQIVVAEHQKMFSLDDAYTIVESKFEPFKVAFPMPPNSTILKFNSDGTLFLYRKFSGGDYFVSEILGYKLWTTHDIAVTSPFFTTSSNHHNYLISPSDSLKLTIYSRTTSQTYNLTGYKIFSQKNYNCIWNAKNDYHQDGLNYGDTLKISVGESQDFAMVQTPEPNIPEKGLTGRWRVRACIYGQRENSSDLNDGIQFYSNYSFEFNENLSTVISYRAKEDFDIGTGEYKIISVDSSWAGEYEINRISNTLLDYSMLSLKEADKIILGYNYSEHNNLMQLRFNDYQGKDYKLFLVHETTSNVFNHASIKSSSTNNYNNKSNSSLLESFLELLLNANKNKSNNGDRKQWTPCYVCHGTGKVYQYYQWSDCSQCNGRGGSME